MTRSLISVCFAVLSVACGGPLKYQMASTSKAPGADGHLVAEVREAQRQTEFEFEVKNLPPADRITDAGTSYVAWARKDSGAVWSRLGALAYDADNREATLKGSVPEIAFDFEVTAEKADQPVSPSSDVVFKQRVAE